MPKSPADKQKSYRERLDKILQLQSENRELRSINIELRKTIQDLLQILTQKEK